MSAFNFITLPYAIERAHPSFEEPGLQSPESLLRHFIGAHTKKGGRVFDPFAGLGTTLFVAEEMGRVPFGIEANPNRQQWVAGQLDHWTHLVHGDAGRMKSYGFPKMDFCITAPPFMRKSDRWNPLYAGDPAHAGYPAYLKRMGLIIAQLPHIMKRNAPIVVQVDNLPGKTYTPLVFDMIGIFSRHFRLDNEVIVTWEGGRADYRHTHCLIFKNVKKS